MKDCMESTYRLFEKWRELFPVARKIAFRDAVLENPYCAECRLCCGPQPEEEPFPMALLDSQIGPHTGENFYMLDEHSACLDQRGCRALGPDGCRLNRGERPPACNLFPFVIVDMRLYLYKICPAALLVSREEIMDNAVLASEWINLLPASDVRRISISRRVEDLADKYIDLGIELSGV